MSPRVTGQILKIEGVETVTWKAEVTEVPPSTRFKGVKEALVCGPQWG